jgi:hypothetical protein
VRLDDGARKRQKKGVLTAVHDDGELISESGIRGDLDHEKRISGLDIEAENFNERPEEAKMRIIIILGDRLRNFGSRKERIRRYYQEPRSHYH